MKNTLAILVLLCFALSVFGQAPPNPWPALCGAGAPDSYIRSPLHRTKVFCNSFELGISQKRQAKTDNYLAAQGAAQMIPAYDAWFALLANPSELPNEVDQSIEALRPIWYSCGPVWQARFDSVNWRAISVTLMPTPFWVPVSTAGAIWASGEAVDGFTVMVAVQTPHLIISNPANAWLETAGPYIMYELGNAAGLQVGYRPTSLDNELGSFPPCSRTSF